MQSHTRALAAASAFAAITGKKVAGLYDHNAGRHLRIAAECRGQRLQAYDGERSVSIDGMLPDLYDHGEKAIVSLDVDWATARGYDHKSARFFDVTVTDQLAQLYDHAEQNWFAFDVQVA